MTQQKQNKFSRMTLCSWNGPELKLESKELNLKLKR